MIHIALSEKTAAAYLDRLFVFYGVKSIARLENVSAVLDDFLSEAKWMRDAFRSRGAERIIQRLCGIENALRAVTSEDILDHADWKDADDFDFRLSGRSCSCPC